MNVIIECQIIKLYTWLFMKTVLISQRAALYKIMQ